MTAPMAQWIKASDYGSEGWGFESLWARHYNIKLSCYPFSCFQTTQVTELLTQYGPIAEMWIDIPRVLGRGYRTFLYNHMAEVQPERVTMMNSGINDVAEYNV